MYILGGHRCIHLAFPVMAGRAIQAMLSQLPQLYAASELMSRLNRKCPILKIYVFFVYLFAYLFYNLTTVTPPSSLLNPSSLLLPPHSPPSLLLFLFRGGQASPMDVNQTWPSRLKAEAI